MQALTTPEFTSAHTQNSEMAIDHHLFAGRDLRGSAITETDARR